MISIVQYISEGLYQNLDKRFQETKLAKTVDRANDKIDNFLEKSYVGKKYLGLENKVGNDVVQGSKAVYNGIANLNDRLHRRNFRVRK